MVIMFMDSSFLAVHYAIYVPSQVERPLCYRDRLPFFVSLCLDSEVDFLLWFEILAREADFAATFSFCLFRGFSDCIFDTGERVESTLDGTSFFASSVIESFSSAFFAIAFLLRSL